MGLLSASALLAAIVYAGLVAQAIITKVGLEKLYTYHPLSGSAFLVFAVIAIATAQRPYTERGKHKALITQHGYWQVAATLLAVACNATIYINKERNGWPHLKSWHGKLGAATTSLWLLQQVAGGVIWYFPKLVGSGAQLRDAYIKHGMGGYLAFVLLLTTHSLALAGSYQGYKKGTLGWYGLAGLLASAGSGILLGTGPLLRRAFKGKPGPAAAAAAAAKQE